MSTYIHIYNAHPFHLFHVHLAQNMSDVFRHVLLSDVRIRHVLSDVCQNIRHQTCSNASCLMSEHQTSDIFQLEHQTCRQLSCSVLTQHAMGWLWLVGSIK